ncbi:hypothetical protein P3S67_029853 [Capsicum chacoense]
MSYNNLSEKIPRNPYFDTLYQDGTTYIGNKYLCGAPDAMDCSNHTPSIIKKIEEKYDQENFLFVLVIFFGYVTGISGLFLLLYLIKNNLRSTYWRAIDRIVLKIVKRIPWTEVVNDGDFSVVYLSNNVRSGLI